MTSSCERNRLALAKSYNAKICLALAELHRTPSNFEFFCGGENLLYLFEYLKIHHEKLTKIKSYYFHDFSSLLYYSGRSNKTYTRRQIFFNNFKLKFFYDQLSILKRIIKLKIYRQKPKYHWTKYIQKNIIHFSGHRRDENFVAPNFSHSIEKPTIKKNQQLRKEFSKIMIEKGIEKEHAEILSTIYPSSYIEYFEFYRSVASKFSGIDTIVANIYGVMEDPLLAFLACENKSSIKYVQHGGYYGFTDNVVHEIERLECDEMYYWGVGKNNCFPTKFPINKVKVKNNKIFYILSHHASECDIISAMEFVEKMKNITDFEVILVLHPASRSDIQEKHIARGVDFNEVSNAKLLIFDDNNHSLIYARILAGGPFLICDSNRNSTSALFSDGEQFLNVLEKVTYKPEDLCVVVPMVCQGDAHLDEVTSLLHESVTKHPKINHLYEVTL